MAIQQHPITPALDRMAISFAVAGSKGWWHTAAREMRAAGIGRRAIAAHLGVSLSSVTYLFSAKTRETQAAYQLRYRQQQKKRMVDTPSKLPPHVGAKNSIKTPIWVRRAGLIQDFRDVAQSLGEFAAASHCRALLREMRASA